MTDDFPCCKPEPFTPEPNWARIAVLQTEREYLRAYMEREHVLRDGNHPAADRYWHIDKAIKEGIGNA